MGGKRRNKLIVIIPTVILLCISAFNIFENGKDFFEINIYQIVSLIFAFVITFYLTQITNDERRKIDMLDKMLFEIQKELTNECLLKFETEEDRNIALLHQRSIASRLKYLIDNNLFPSIIDDIKYTYNEIQHLRSMYGDHMIDKDYMNKSQKEFKRYITNAEDKIFLMHVKLYK